MPIQQMTPLETKVAMDSEPNSVYIDVRTEQEFSNGHPVGAINAPVAFPSPAGGMEINHDFVTILEKILPKEKPIFCGCQVGIRSQMAAELLEQAGYTNLINVQGGYGGKTDQSGSVVVSGWQGSGLPIETEINMENSYKGLKTKATSK